MRKRQLPSFRPFFRVQEVKRQETAQNIYITPKIISEMIDIGLFNLGSVAIPVSSHSALLAIDIHLTNDKTRPHLCCGFPISGFPRTLADGEALKRASKYYPCKPNRPYPPELTENQPPHPSQNPSAPKWHENANPSVTDAMRNPTSHPVAPPATPAAVAPQTEDATAISSTSQRAQKK